MGAGVLAASATTWAAVGALATLLTAIITLILGLLYTSRQTEYARRAAANARVSADASVTAGQLAKANLDLVREQLEIVREQTRAVIRQAEMATLSLRAQDRPALTSGPLSFDPATRAFSVQVTNRGRGAGSLMTSRLAAGPDGRSIARAMAEAERSTRFILQVNGSIGVLEVDQGTTLKSQRLPPGTEIDMPATLWLAVPVRDYGSREYWTFLFGYRLQRLETLTTGEGRQPTGVYATTRKVIHPDRIDWPVAEVIAEARKARAVDEPPA